MRRILAIVVDAAVFICVVVSAMMMFFSGGGTLSVSGWGYLRYFTVDSNWLLGFTALIALITELVCLRKGEEAAPTWLGVVYLVGSVGTTVTFLTVLCYLGPTMGFGFMYYHANFFMHLSTPLLGLFRILFFATWRKKIPYRFAPLGALPLLIYGVFYMSNVALNNGYGNRDYDWYGFGAAGLGVGIVMLFVMTGAGLLLSYLMALGSNKLWSKGIFIAHPQLERLATQDYYEEHASEYIESTLHSDMTSSYEFFEGRLHGNQILDVGFGSGRDMLHFTQKGYDVEGIDVVEEFIDHARLHNLNVSLADVLTYEPEHPFDGIWASASLLHLSINDLQVAAKRLQSFLVPGGVLFVSLKEGKGEERDEKGRHMTYVDETFLRELGFSEFRRLPDSQGRPIRWINALYFAAE